jgi:DNA replication protein DnaC
MLAELWKYYCPRCINLRALATIQSYISQYIGARYVGAQLKDFNQTAAVKAAMVAYPRGMLYVYGGLGCGKTHFSAALLRYCAGQILNPNKMRGLYFTGAQGFREICLADSWYSLAKHSPVLVIDEMTNCGEFDAGRLFALIDYRYSNAKMTVGISNNSPEQVANGQTALGVDYGAKIMSRMTREGSRNIIELKQRVA